MLPYSTSLCYHVVPVLCVYEFFRNTTGHTSYYQQFDIKLDLEGPDKVEPDLPYNAKVSTLDFYIYI